MTQQQAKGSEVDAELGDLGFAGDLPDRLGCRVGDAQPDLAGGIVARRAVKPVTEPWRFVAGQILVPRFAQMRVERPAQTLRATVLGAASQQVTLSGSTIWADRSLLPLKNLPVIEPELPPMESVAEASVCEALRHAVRRWDRDEEQSIVAINLHLPLRMSYDQMRAIADGVGSFAASGLRAGQPLVLVTEQDYAQVLGQTIAGARPHLPVIVVDQIGLGEGDFIDIGEPMFDGRVVPVSVKTLVFYQ